ncbi:MAG: HRDC domain-containing protein, partial [Candidatus Cloacimonetes bacterium]|nr:HRDC domain-containing protein [Candidatus Cloacimonadota bacterium]
RNHHLLSTYNIGNDLSKKQWFHLSRQFIQQKLINKDTQYGSLKIIQKGWEVLQNKVSVNGLLMEEKVKFKKIKEVDYEFDHTLFEKLRKKRKEIADEKGIPPFIIFHDTSLIEMSSFFPKSGNSFMKINGVGETKFERYGGIFLEIIKDYCLEFGIEEKMKEDRTLYRMKLENSDNKDNTLKTTFAFEKIREELPKAYEKWTELDDKLLDISFQMDEDINELAKLFQRKPGAIRSRLKKNGLIK